jgi:hypothetical protein
MRRVTALAVACLASTGIRAATPACGGDIKGAQRAESAHYTVAYRTRPAKIEVTRHFSMIVAVCAKSGARAPDALRVDARMPEHGHGMNYTAAVKSLGSGRFEADGLMFHMPGRWELMFDVRSGDTAEAVIHNISLQ